MYLHSRSARVTAGSFPCIYLVPFPIRTSVPFLSVRHSPRTDQRMGALTVSGIARAVNNAPVICGGLTADCIPIRDTSCVGMRHVQFIIGASLSEPHIGAGVRRVIPGTN